MRLVSTFNHYTFIVVYARYSLGQCLLFLQVNSPLRALRLTSASVSLIRIAGRTSSAGTNVGQGSAAQIRT